MEALKEWVRSLAMLMILATCLELLVPMGGMKKYVRMTMGLLVMLTMINPLFTWLGQPIQLDPALFTPEADQRLPTVDEIMVEAGRFREKNEALAAAEAKARLAAEAADAARRVAGVASAQAEVDLEEQDGNQVIARVTVTISPGERQKGVAPVLPVLPVRPGSSEEQVDAAQGGARQPEGAEMALAGQVREEVARRLGLTSDGSLIQVLVQREPTSQRR